MWKEKWNVWNIENLGNKYTIQIISAKKARRQAQIGFTQRLGNIIKSYHHIALHWAYTDYQINHCDAWAVSWFLFCFWVSLFVVCFSKLAYFYGMALYLCTWYRYNVHTTRQKNLCALPSPTTFMGLIKHHSNQNFIRQWIEWKTKSCTNSSSTSSHPLSCESINVLYIGRVCIYFEMHLFKFTILYLHIFRYCRKYFCTNFWNIFFSGWKLLWCIT